MVKGVIKPRSQKQIESLNKARAALATKRQQVKAQKEYIEQRQSIVEKKVEILAKKLEANAFLRRLNERVAETVRRQTTRVKVVLDQDINQKPMTREELKSLSQQMAESRGSYKHTDLKFFDKYKIKNKHTEQAYGYPVSNTTNIAELINTEAIVNLNKLSDKLIKSKIEEMDGKRFFVVKMREITLDPIDKEGTELVLTGNVFSYKNRIVDDIKRQNDTQNANIKTTTFTISIDNLSKISDYLHIQGAAKVKVSDSFLYFYIGFAIYGYGSILEKEADENESLFMNLEAYEPCSDKLFHDATSYSTQASSKLCIYETFWYHYIVPDNKKDIKSVRALEQPYDLFQRESKEVKDIVKRGSVYEFLKLKSEQMKDETLYLRLFRPQHEVRDDGSIFYPTQGFSLKNKEFTNITDVNDFLNKKTFLYDSKHVAPAIMKTKQVKKEHTTKFSLKPALLESNEKDIVSLGYDIETYQDENKKSIVYSICLSNGQAFYGVNCVKDFCDYLDKFLLEKGELTKTHKHNAVKKFHIYGFNNSRFDNLFIWEELKIRDKKLKILVVESSIKQIKYGNITFLDLSLYYSGSLKSCAESFGIKLHKGTFPYKFVTKDNLYYSGSIPDKEYWNSEEDLFTYIDNGYLMYFDMKNYTEKYCILDAKIAHEIAKKHLEHASGVINNSKFDVRTCPTAAGSALKIFQQVFLKDTLWESPAQQQIKEREAFKGGRTEVFKKQWRSKAPKYLYYFDRNSSYPASMREVMPVEFLRSFPYVPKMKLVSHWLYKAKVMYKGELTHIFKDFKSDPNWIPNILERAPSGDIIASKKTDYIYLWGCELQEAQRNNCVLDIKEVNEYRGETVFKEYAEYFYNERLKVKKTNPSKAEFYKLLMNSLYGKFGQQIKPSWDICSDESQVNKILSGPRSKLLDFDFIDDFMVIKYTDGRKDDRSVGSLVRFASYITALARTALSEIMRDVGHENVYYCDTDSIFTSKKPSAALLSQTELGKWKQETNKKTGNICDIIAADFLAPKSYMYEIDTKKDNTEKDLTKKAKGHRESDITIADFDIVINGGVATIKNPTMFRRALTGVSIDEQDRSLSTVYNKRVWTGNNSEAYASLADWSLNKFGK